MKIRSIIASALASVALFSGCVKTELASLEGISAEPSLVALGFEGGTTKSIIKTTAAWTLEIPSEASEWLTVTPTSGDAAPNGVEVTFTMTATESPRKVEAKLVVGDKYQILTIGQYGQVPMKIVTCADFANDDVCPTGGSYYVEGFITKVEKYDYGNLYIKDDNGDELYVYGTLDADGNSKNFTSLGIDVGDKVILYGPKKYYGTTLEMENATLIEVTVPAVFDLNFRGIRDMYNEKYPEKAEEYSKLTKDEWKNLLKADLQDLKEDATEIKIPYTFKGESFEIVPGVDWIHLKGISNDGGNYVATLSVDAYSEKAAPRKTTLVLKGVTTVNKVKKESNLELPVVQYGITPDPVTIAEAVAQGKTAWVTIKGLVTGLHKKGCHVTDAEGNTIYAYVNGADEKAVGAVLGDEVLLTGELDSYRQFYQIKTPVIRVLSSKNAVTYPQPAEVNAAFLAALPSQDQTAKYIVATGIADANNYGAVTVADHTISAYYILDSFKMSDYYGKNIMLKGYTVQYQAAKDDKKADLRIVVTSVEEVQEGPVFTFTDSALPTAYPSEETTITVSGADFKILNVANYGTMIQLKKEGGYIASATDKGVIKSLKLTWNPEKSFYPSNLTVSAGATMDVEKTLTGVEDADAKTLTFDLTQESYVGCKFFKVENASTYTVYLKSIEITY